MQDKITLDFSETGYVSQKDRIRSKKG